MSREWRMATVQVLTGHMLWGTGGNYPNVNIVGNERRGARITSLGFALPSCSIYGIACLDYRREPWAGRNFHPIEPSTSTLTFA